MHHFKQYPFPAGIALCIFFLVACGHHKNNNEYIADDPKELEDITAKLIRNFASNGDLGSIQPDTGKIELQKALVQHFYSSQNQGPAWSNNENWNADADSLFNFIASAQLYGLFPEDYHYDRIRDTRSTFFADSIGKKERKDGRIWALVDLLLTDAFIGIMQDIKLGRLPQDSVTLRKDSILPDGFYVSQFEEMKKRGLQQMISLLEPGHKGYKELKAGIRKFLDSAEYKNYTRVPYPEKDIAKFNRVLQTRLFEADLIASDSIRLDSIQLAEAVKKFQKKKGMQVDGKAGEATVRALNVNDREKFIRIAISMDKYKMLPEKMPARYIWVNVSSNFLELVERDKVTISSKVICGKSKTPTPLLTGMISQLITYPQWVPPPSIVSKEILPAVKRNPGYLARKGFHLVDSKGNTVDPYSVNWEKYRTQIPYRIVQGSGDANALGIMKFVFDNKYSVYLHDTNQRYLFNNAMRSLSHGCVRVQEWDKLMISILRNDSLNAAGSGSYTKIDSVRTWLERKEKKTITVRNRIPLYIRYITCVGQDGTIVFYDDVYAEDKQLREKYFASK